MKTRIIALFAGLLAVLPMTSAWAATYAYEVTTADELTTALESAASGELVLLNASLSVSSLTIPEGVTLDVARGCTLTNTGTIDLNGDLGVIGTFVNTGATLNKGANARLIQKTQVYAIEKRSFVNHNKAKGTYEVTRTASGTLTGATKDLYQVSADDMDDWHDAKNIAGEVVTGPGECVYCTYPGSTVFQNQTNMNGSRKYLASDTIANVATGSNKMSYYGRIAVLLKNNSTAVSLSSSVTYMAIDAAGFTYSGKISLGNNSQLKFMNGKHSGGYDIKGPLTAVNATMGSVSCNIKSTSAYLWLFDSTRSGFSVSNAGGSTEAKEYVVCGNFDSAYNTSYTVIYGGNYKNKPSTAKFASGRAILIGSGTYPYSVVTAPVECGGEVLASDVTTYYASADQAVREAVSGNTVTLHANSSQSRTIKPGESLTIVCADGAQYDGTITCTDSNYTVDHTDAGYYFTCIDPAQATATVNGKYFDSAKGAIESINGNSDGSVVVKVMKNSTSVKPSNSSPTVYTLDLNGCTFKFDGTFTAHTVTVVDSVGGGQFLDNGLHVGSLVVKGGIFPNMDPKPYLADGLVRYVAEDGYYHVVEDLPAFEATIGVSEETYTHYEKANTAIARASANDTVTLYATATVGCNLKRGDKLTIVLMNGATYDPALIGTSSPEDSMVEFVRDDNKITFECVVDLSKYEACIGNEYYKTAVEAIKAMKGNAVATKTVKIFRDITSCNAWIDDYSETHTTQTSSSWFSSTTTYTYTFTANPVSYTLDLNGHSFAIGSSWTTTHTKNLLYQDKGWSGKTNKDYSIPCSTHKINITDTSDEGSGVYNVENPKTCIAIQEISGGTFNFDPTQYVKSDLLVVRDNGNGTWTVEQKNKPHVEIVGGGRYPTLAEAIAALQGGETIRLLTANSENVTAGSAAFTFDVNGKAFTGSITPANGYELKQNADGTFGYAQKTGVAKIDGIGVFQTLAEAFAAVPADGTQTTVSLLTDCNLGDVGAAAGVTVGNGQNVVLDLAGRTIYVIGSGSGESCAILCSGGNLKIVDSSDLSNGTISYSSQTPSDDKSYSTSVFIVKGGSLVVEGGNFRNGAEAGACYMIDALEGEVVTLGGSFFGRACRKGGAEIALDALCPERYLIDGKTDADGWTVRPYPSVVVKNIGQGGLVVNSGNGMVDTSSSGRISLPITLDAAYSYELVANDKVNNPLADWKAEFSIDYNRNMGSYAVCLCGAYDGAPLIGSKWFVSDMAGCNIGGAKMFLSREQTIPFSQVCGEMSEVKAGLYNVKSINRGVRATIEFRLYEGSVLDGRYIVLDHREVILGAGDNAAMVGSDESSAFYSTLEGAVGDLTTGDKTIKLCKDCGEAVTIGKACTIDENGFSFTGTITPADGFAVKRNGDVWTVFEKATSEPVEVKAADGETKVAAVEVEKSWEEQVVQGSGMQDPTPEQKQELVQEALQKTEGNGLKVWENKLLEQAEAKQAPIETGFAKVNKEEVTVNDKQIVATEVKGSVDGSNLANLETGTYQQTIVVKDAKGEEVAIADPEATAKSVVKNDSAEKTVVLAIPGATTVASAIATTPQAGDQIKVYDTTIGGYRCWKYENSGWTTEPTVVNGKEIANPTAAADKQLSAGSVILYERKEGSGSPAPVTVVTDYTKDLVSEPIEVPTATDGSDPKWNLMANPTGREYDLNKIIANETANLDKIVVLPKEGLGQTTYEKGSDNKWGYYKTETYQKPSGKMGSRRVWVGSDEKAPVVKGGQSMWYISNGGKPKIEWNK